MPKKNISDAMVIAALHKNAGIATLAAKDLGVTRQTMWQRIKGSLRLQKAIEEIEEEMLDIADGHIKLGVRKGDKDWVRYYMTAKGLKRGYGNKIQTSIDDAQIEAIVAGLGGDPEAYRAALLRLGHNPEEVQG